MYSRQPARWAGRFGGFGGGGPIPRDLIALLVVLFATFSLQFFAATAPLLSLVRLTPAVWERGYLWQLATYPFVGFGPPSIWFLLALLMVFWFGRDLFWRLGRRRFWSLLVGIGALAGAVALAVDLASGAGRSLLQPAPFVLLQGQNIVLVVLVAAFATLYGEATVYLMFVLPLQAKWFLPLEILFALLGYFTTKDLAGFLGICAAVGATWLALRPGRLRRLPREAWLRLQQRWIRLRLAVLRRRRGFRVIEGERGNGKVHRGPWVH
jgi:hypothetical protein